MTSFFDDNKRLLEKIDAELARRSTFGSECPMPLAEAIRYSLLAPGKRLRPMLLLWATELCGGEISAALPAAAAVEMVHAYSLIHDDLPAMDNDDLRRGRSTSHKKFGEGIAILAGDGLLTLAFETLGTLAETVSPNIAARCMVSLAQAAGVEGMVGGQADDILFAKATPETQISLRTAEHLDAIHRRKTGRMIRVSMEMGGIIAGANVVQFNGLRRYGTAVGEAFQITDDLLDLTGHTNEVGKQTGKDAAAGKLTHPLLHGIEMSRSLVRALIDAAVAALEPFEDSGAKRALTERAFSLAERTT